MKQRLADYVADFLVNHGVSDCFSVVGGGAMHLNDALGHKEGLKVTYNHHEQASAIAAEAYARLDNKIAALCVTTGPGGTNALTGVVGGNGIEVSAVAANKQTISAKVSAAEGNLISVDENGLYAAMYYDGDDVE